MARKKITISQYIDYIEYIHLRCIGYQWLVVVYILLGLIIITVIIIDEMLLLIWSSPPGAEIDVPRKWEFENTYSVVRT